MGYMEQNKPDRHWTSQAVVKSTVKDRRLGHKLSGWGDPTRAQTQNNINTTWTCSLPCMPAWEGGDGNPGVTELSRLALLMSSGFKKTLHKRVRQKSIWGLGLNLGICFVGMLTPMMLFQAEFAEHTLLVFSRETVARTGISAKLSICLLPP